LRSVFVSAEHNSSAKEIVALLKFQRVKAAANVISDWLDLQLPSLSPETIILPVPTANSRVRRRGYDQACLIGRSLSRKRDLGCLEALKRTGSTRQVGSNRADRFQQLENAFVLQSVNKIRGSPVLLVDDVLTTGATLESAAKTIESHGALSIDAVVFAH
jgi:ComF family protein